MSGSEASAEDRTEAATPRRLLQAREQGQLAVSRDLTTLASLCGAAFGAVAFMPPAGRMLTEQTAGFLGLLDRMRLDGGIGPGGPLGGVLLAAAMLVGAVAVPAALCAILCVLIQTEFYIGGAPIRFQLSRISPAAGLARILSMSHLLDFLKSCLRLALLSLLAWSVLRHATGATLPSIGADSSWLLTLARSQVENLARPLLLVLAVFAVADVFLVRFQHAKRMRMTREQIRLEMRESDGDPQIKSKLRRIREQRSRRRMMSKVKSADVVITNPTHYAVALSYQRGGSTAPRVVAKGMDFIAARIREEATGHGVPIVPNPPLARALYQVELDREIPAEHYRAVAEVIAFVWKLKSRLAAPAMRA
jgi:flagellar biosynthetic protein FlhB